MTFESFINRIYWRERVLARKIYPYIGSPKSILDLGAGSCKLTKVIEDNLGIPVFPVDVVDYNVTDLRLAVYDGKQLPFADGEFDVTLLVFVLHHAEDPINLLREALRVTRSYIIVVEDTPRNRFEKRAWRWFDDLLNDHDHTGVSIAHTVGSSKSWRRCFKDVGLEVGDASVFRSAIPILWMYQHTLFRLNRLS